MRKKVFTALIVVVFIFSTTCPVFAELPYNGYLYDPWNQAVPSQVGYEPEQRLTGVDLGVGMFKTPEDMFVDSNKDIYILDSGNNRVVVFDAKFKLKKIIDSLVSSNGAEKLNNPTGIFVTRERDIYVADKGNKRVVVFDLNGKIKKQIGRPVSELVPAETEFRPTKVLVNRLGTVFVIAEGFFQGAITYDTNGKFLGFYGSNKVEVTLQVVQDFIWKKIFSKDQKDKMRRYVPIEYVNFDVDQESFIYTCTKASKTSVDEIKKMNTLGNNILRKRIKNIAGSSGDYGDIEKAWFMNKLIDTQFVDIKVDEEGFINCLDYTRGRIFQYDQESKLITVFGAIGDSLGSFKAPAAIESLDKKILVLDSKKASITIFTLTPFGQQVHKAVLLYNDGLYEEALQHWEEVLRMNVNYDLAYVGIGKTYYEAGEYEKAMEYFKYGYDRVGRSLAFKELRKKVVRKYFPYAATVVFFVLLVLLAIRFYRRTKFTRKSKYCGKF